MKNKIAFYFIAALSFICMPVYASTNLEVEALTPFNSLTPAKTMKVMALKKVEFENGIVFEDGTIITGDIIDVKQPKRAKLNASFKFQPTAYTYNGKTTKVLDSDFIAKYSEKKELDKGDLALTAATTAGNIFLKIPMLSQGVSMVKGMVKNEEGNILKSGAVQVYKDSPLSYVEEGKDVVINKEDVFVLKFKTHKAEDLDAPPQNNLTPAETPDKSESEQTSQTFIDVNTVSVPIIKEDEQTIQPIKSLHPDEVLLEVESSQKTAPVN